jgi:hypothetical protein
VKLVFGESCELPESTWGKRFPFLQNVLTNLIDVHRDLVIVLTLILPSGGLLRNLGAARSRKQVLVLLPRAAKSETGAQLTIKLSPDLSVLLLRG